MPSDTFTLFQELPMDLRIAIWKLAVQSDCDQRHAHCFLVVPEATPSAECVTGGILRFGANGQLNHGWKLAVPHITDPLGLESMYLRDSELWTACRESRKVMENHFKWRDWWREMPHVDLPQRLPLPGSHSNQRGVIHTASYVDTNGKTNCITIRPHEDLTYLKPIYARNFSWLSQLCPNELLLPANGCLPPALPQLGFLGRNIAIDYDPIMMDVLTFRPIPSPEYIKLTYDSFDSMVNLLTESSDRTIWFVDHGVKRRRKSSRSSAPRNDRIVFYSQLSIFTEVREEDVSDWVIQDGPGRRETVYQFLALMLGHLGERTTLDRRDRFKVLACERRNYA